MLTLSGTIASAAKLRQPLDVLSSFTGVTRPMPVEQHGDNSHLYFDEHCIRRSENTGAKLL